MSDTQEQRAFTSFTRYQEHVPGRAVLKRGGDDWNDLQLRSHVLPAQLEAAPAPAIPQHTLTFAYAGHIEGDRRTGGGTWQSFDTETDGHVTVRPAGLSMAMRWRGKHPVRTLSLYLLPDHLEEVALQMGMAPARVELRDRFNVPDPVLRAIAEELQKIASGTRSRSSLYLQTALQTLSMRLLHQFGRHPPEPEETGALSQSRLQRIENYVHANLAADLSLDDLAQVVDLSKYHFSRRFKRRTGQSPYQFVIYERVRAARRQLRETTHSLARIALNVGFNSQSHFTRTFKRHVGLPPGRYRSAWQ
jgi:AraC family transcriptional regulator